jgi:folate-binding protein YgfZ
MSLLVDQSGSHVLVVGGDRVRFLQGMCMGNIATLADGDHRLTCVLSAKGRVEAMFDVVVAGDTLWLVGEPAHAAATRDLLDRYVIADDVEVTVCDLAVHRLWTDAASVWTAAPVLAPPPGTPASADAIEALRIEAGLPRFGVDVGPDRFPFESLLAGAIDYQKGCYVGQEPIARVHARGSAAHMLRGLTIEGAGAVAAGAAIEVDGKVVGQVSSAAVSPRLGSIALATLPRASWQPGGAARVDGRAATVVELPFA